MIIFYLISLYYIYLLYASLFAISEIMEIIKVAIFITKLENRITMNIITHIATMLPMVVIKFLPVE